MKIFFRLTPMLMFAAASLLALPTTCVALAAGQDAAAEEPKTIKVFDVLTLQIPAQWKEQPVRSRIIEHEYVVTQGEGDEAPSARVTMMAAGGDIAANIKRWEGQFSEGGEPKVEKKSVAGQTVHIVELEGTFSESMGGGPFAGGKTVKRENYGMLGGIIETEKGGKYFIKMTGPKDLIEAQREAFKAMLEGMKG